MRTIFGTDIGGVLAPPVTRSQAFNIDDTFLQNLKPISYSFEVLSKLANQLFGPKNMFIVSYCSAKSEEHSRRWLQLHDFLGRTGIPTTNWFYCRDRSHKNIICQELGIGHFIDDNINVLNSLETVQNRYLFNPDKKPIENINSEIMIINSWADLHDQYF